MAVALGVIITQKGEERRRRCWKSRMFREKEKFVWKRNRRVWLVLNPSFIHFDEKFSRILPFKKEKCWDAISGTPLKIFFLKYSEKCIDDLTQLACFSLCLLESRCRSHHNYTCHVLVLLPRGSFSLLQKYCLGILRMNARVLQWVPKLAQAFQSEGLD